MLHVRPDNACTHFTHFSLSLSVSLAYDVSLCLTLPFINYTHMIRLNTCELCSYLDLEQNFFEFFAAVFVAHVMAMTFGHVRCIENVISHEYFAD